MYIKRNLPAFILIATLGLLLFGTSEVMAKKEADPAQRIQAQKHDQKRVEKPSPQKSRPSEGISKNFGNDRQQRHESRGENKHTAQSPKQSPEQKKNPVITRNQRSAKQPGQQNMSARTPRPEQKQGVQSRPQAPNHSKVAPGKHKSVNQHGAPKAPGKPALNHKKPAEQNHPKKEHVAKSKNHGPKPGFQPKPPVTHKNPKNHSPKSNWRPHHQHKNTHHVAPRKVHPTKHKSNWRPHHGPKKHVRPKTHVVKHVIHHLPPRHSVILHGGHKYHYHSGRYYRPHGAGYILVRPPVGLFMLNLPIGSRAVISAGITFHTFGDVFYRAVPGGYRVVEPLRAAAPPSTDQVMVQVDLLNVRYAPSDEEEVIAQVEGYTVLDVLGNVPGWLFIEIPGAEIQGWVQEEFVTTSIGLG